MLSDISILCVNNQIRICWKWTEEDIEKVNIVYKEKGSGSGDGVEFVVGGIMKIPYIESGTAVRNLQGERGLFTFVFLVYRKDKSLADKIVIDDVMIGNKINVVWNTKRTSEGTVLSFADFQFSIPEGVLIYEQDGIQYPINQSVNSQTRLLFLDGVQEREIHLKISPPYDQMYIL